MARFTIAVNCVTVTGPDGPVSDGQVSADRCLAGSGIRSGLNGLRAIVDHLRTLQTPKGFEKVAQGKTRCAGAPPWDDATRTIQP